MKKKFLKIFIRRITVVETEIRIPNFLNSIIHDTSKSTEDEKLDLKEIHPVVYNLALLATLLYRNLIAFALVLAFIVIILIIVY